MEIFAKLDTRIAGVIREFTQCLEIAESEIARAKQAHPDRAAFIDRVFAAARPTPPLRGKAPAIYRAHVRELCERAAAGESLQLGTDAEVLCAMMATATRAPLYPAGYNLAERLLYKIIPDAVAALGEPTGREDWPKQFDEDLADAKRKLTRLDR